MKVPLPIRRDDETVINELLERFFSPSENCSRIRWPNRARRAILLRRGGWPPTVAIPVRPVVFELLEFQDFCSAVLLRE